MPDEIFRDDGRIVLPMRGGTLTLARPKLGEFRSLRESLQDMHDRMTVEAQRSFAESKLVSAWLSAEDDPRGPLPEDLDPDASEEDVRAWDRIRGREMARSQEDARIEWLVRAMKSLGPSPAPDVDDLEPWMITAEFVGRVMKHWQQVPSLSGGPAPT